MKVIKRMLVVIFVLFNMWTLCFLWAALFFMGKPGAAPTWLVILTGIYWVWLIAASSNIVKFINKHI